MKITYYKDVDVINIKFNDAEIFETDENKPGVIIDYDKDGNIVEIEVLNASKRTEQPNKIEYESA